MMNPELVTKLQSFPGSPTLEKAQRQLLLHLEPRAHSSRPGSPRSWRCAKKNGQPSLNMRKKLKRKKRVTMKMVLWTMCQLLWKHLGCHQWPLFEKLCPIYSHICPTHAHQVPHYPVLTPPQSNPISQPSWLNLKEVLTEALWLYYIGATLFSQLGTGKTNWWPVWNIHKIFCSTKNSWVGNYLRHISIDIVIQLQVLSAFCWLCWQLTRTWKAKEFIVSARISSPDDCRVITFLTR